MGFLEGFTSPNENTPSPTKAVTPTSGGFLKGFTIQNQTIQDKISKDSAIRIDTKIAQQEAAKANSFSGMVKNTIKAIPTSAAEILPGTTQSLRELKADPLGLKGKPQNAINDIGNTVIDSIKKAGDSISNVFSKYSDTPGTAGRVGAGFQAAADVGGAILSPITALFAGANDIPVLNSVAKIVTGPFAISGDIGKNVGHQVVKNLPISQEAKDKINTGVEDLLSLAAQMAFGGTITKMSTPKVLEMVKKIKEKHSIADANTIVTKAHEIATDKLINETRANPKQVMEEAIQKYSPKAEYLKKDIATSGTEYAKAIASGDLPKEKIYKADGTLQAETLVHVIDDVAGKIEQQVPGLGEKFKESINLNNATAESIREQGTKFIDKMDKEAKIIDRPILEDGTRVTKAANDINEQLVKQGVEQLPVEEQSKYQTGSYKKDLESTTELMNTDFQKAVDVATGKAEVPENIRYPQVLFNAIEAHAMKTGDVQLQMDLAKSSLGTQLSEAGGTLGSHGFNDNPNNSPVKLIKKVIDAREQQAVKKGGKSIKQQKTEVVEKLKKEARKTSLKRQDWDSFIRSIQC